jgi:hypothetical protein
LAPAGEADPAKSALNSITDRVTSNLFFICSLLDWICSLKYRLPSSYTPPFSILDFNQGVLLKSTWKKYS